MIGCLPVLAIWIFVLLMVWVMGSSWGGPVSLILLVTGIVAGLAATLKWLVDNSPDNEEQRKRRELVDEVERAARKRGDDDRPET